MCGVVSSYAVSNGLVFKAVKVNYEFNLYFFLSCVFSDVAFCFSFTFLSFFGYDKATNMDSVSMQSNKKLACNL